MPANSNIRTCRPWPRPEAQSPISALGSTLHVACIPWFRLVGPHGASRRACRGSSVVWVLAGMHVVGLEAVSEASSEQWQRNT
jgi:hypothetical protein